MTSTDAAVPDKLAKLAKLAGRRFDIAGSRNPATRVAYLAAAVRPLLAAGPDPSEGRPSAIDTAGMPGRTGDLKMFGAHGQK